MVDTFARVFLGHMVGDYLLQSKYMAIHKTDRTDDGAKQCITHCAIYTVAVMTFLQSLNPVIICLVFLSHWPIDRNSLATFWLKFINGRDLKTEFESDEPYREIRLPFACLVYAAADNTMHLVLLWLITKLI